jgi:4-amino-4-deoxy-L-arabinose transferase-like glycosyltransferase
MFIRGDFFTPWFNGSPRFEKPILLYWLQAPFFAVLGPTELAARVPAVLAGLATVVAVFIMVRRQVSTRAGLVAGMALATTFRFVVYARQGLTDVPVVCALTLALMTMTCAVKGSPRGRIALLAWVLVAMAVLLKGPVGLLAPVIWSAWAAVEGGRQALARTRPAIGIAIAAAVAATWYVPMVLLHGYQFVQVAIRSEIVARYLSPDFPGYRRGVFYFWYVWVGDAAPWSIFGLSAAIWAFANRSRLTSGQRSLLQLSGLWFVSTLVIFSGSRYKLPHYILPAYPAVAIAVGVFADAIMREPRWSLLWRVPSWISALALIVCAALTGALLVNVFEVRPFDTTFALPVLLAVGGAATAAFASSPVPSAARRTVTSIVATLAVTYGVIGLIVVPRVLRRFQPIPVLGDAVRRLVPVQEPLALAGNYGGPGLVFYGQRPVQQLLDRSEEVEFLSTPGRRHCVIPASELTLLAPIVKRRLLVRAEASVFSVRLKRLLEREPGRATRVLVLVTAE